MKRQYLYLLILLLLTGKPVSAQEKSCSCRDNFDDLALKMETNYIKFHQLSLWANPSEYEARKERFKQISKNTSIEGCSHILQEFLRYFEDGHLFVLEQPEFSEAELEKTKREIKGNKLALDKLNAKLKQKSDSPLAGEWISESSMVVGVVEEGSQFRGYIVESQDKTLIGELKFVLNAGAPNYYGTYYSGKYQPRYVEADVYKDSQYLSLGGALWKRKSLDEKPGNKPFIKQVKTAVVLTIPSFIIEYDEFQKFIKNNAELLNKTELLIIDIRGNTGGNGIYFPLLSLFATGNVPASQGEVVSSAANIEYFKALSKYSPEIYAPLIERMTKNPNKIVDGPAYKAIELEKNETKIKNVAILTDRGNFSAAESFILHAKGSSNKVKTFGSPTGGMIDYTSTTSLKLCSGNQKIFFGYPTSTLNKEILNSGYNKTGIKPDVPIKEDVQNKILFIIEYYLKR